MPPLHPALLSTAPGLCVALALLGCGGGNRSQAPVAPHSLTVTISGTGSVGSTPAGLACTGSCTTSFAAGSTVTLLATPAADQAFAGWSGDCQGSAPRCTLTLATDKQVTASFTAATAGGNAAPALHLGASPHAQRTTLAAGRPG
ncbi:InlB B-repeat-containing protein [Pelomonas nitida]|uniref:Bacterial repeat domain-containing protein n=1 Tax=Pelomonas nitida TaxID=3299027 RepID=A0ABW7G5M5_9BURK